jgi:ATP-binding cassette subfamily B multidrug efflux pump
VLDIPVAELAGQGLAAAQVVPDAQRLPDVQGVLYAQGMPVGPGTAEVQPALLAFQSVHFGYPKSGASLFQGLSFSLAPGTTLGIIGPTGSGKSTLAALILRQYDVDGGEILFQGRALPEWPRDQLLAAMAYVPQKSILLSGTVADNLRLGQPGADDAALWWALELAQAADFVRLLPDQLASRVEQGGRNFSGGQRQRLAIARALLVQPALLVLDDSTSALDYATEAALRQALQRDPALQGLSVLVISQRVAAVRQADQILVLDDGQVIGVGTHEALLASNETYREICQSQLTERGCAAR